MIEYGYYADPLSGWAGQCTHPEYCSLVHPKVLAIEYYYGIFITRWRRRVFLIYPYEEVHNIGS